MLLVIAQHAHWQPSGGCDKDPLTGIFQHVARFLIGMKRVTDDMNAMLYAELHTERTRAMSGDCEAMANNYLVFGTGDIIRHAARSSDHLTSMGSLAATVENQGVGKSNCHCSSRKSMQPLAALPRNSCREE